MSSPVRILHIVTHMERGGLETMIMNYYRAIDRTQIQFDFLVHRDTHAAYDDEILSLGGKIHRLPPLDPFGKTYLSRLDDFFRSHRYPIVHCHLDCMSGIPLKYAKKHGVPVRIAHAHSTSQDRDWKYPLKLFFKRRISRYATDFFACNDPAGKWMFGDHDLTVMNNAIDTASYAFSPDRALHIRRTLGIDENALVIGHVGRFSLPKNHSFLVELFAALAKQRPDAVLLLVGDGELRTAIEAKLDALSVLDKVIFTGVRSDVADLLQAMDVFVFPSLYEGLPVSLIEAQAAGLPCIISDRIPVDCRKTDLVRQLALETSLDPWIAAVTEAAASPRSITTDQIAQAGFDIQQNARWLEHFYKSKTQSK